MNGWAQSKGMGKTWFYYHEGREIAYVRNTGRDDITPFRFSYRIGGVWVTEESAVGLKFCQDKASIMALKFIEIDEAEQERQVILLIAAAERIQSKIKETRHDDT